MKELFFELLRISLGTRDVLSRVPSVVEWMSLFVEAQKQAVVGVLFAGIEQCTEHNQKPPQDVLLAWIGKTQMTVKYYELQCKRAKELTLIFQKKGIPSCVLKGIGFSFLYPTPAYRQSGDIDIWIDGDRKKVMAWLKNQCELEHAIWHHVEAKFFNDVSSEIHFHPCWMYNPINNRRLQRWFEEQKRAQMVVNRDVGFAVPSVKFNAVYSLVHFYHHLIEEGIGVRHVVDYYYIIKNLNCNDIEIVNDELRYFGLQRIASAMMWVLHEVCGMHMTQLICSPNRKEGLFLLDEVMRGGNFGHYRNDNRRRNSIVRLWVLMKHYPNEAIWVVPWKMWHKCWRVLNS